jgi:hypothetical protein
MSRFHSFILLIFPLLFAVAGLLGPAIGPPGDDPATTTAAGASLELTEPGGSVTVPHDPALDLPTALTIEAWVRHQGGEGCATIASKEYRSSYWFGFCDGKLRYYSGGSDSVGDGVTRVPAEVWTHVAVVWAAGGSRTYYINGETDYNGEAGPAPTSTTLPFTIGANPGPDTHPFLGHIAEVRVWNLARSQNEIRRTMHVTLDEARPGLVATWHLNDDYADAIGGHDGTPTGTASLNGPQAPPQPATVPVDTNFNTLPHRRYGAATVFLPSQGRGLLIGGSRTPPFGTCDKVDRLDPATGVTVPFATLPVGLLWPAAAYVPANDTVYVLGGTICGGDGSHSNRIYAIDATAGTVRTLASTLPAAATSLAAVYHEGLDKIVIFGGLTRTAVLDTISVFDPATETLTGPLALTLPAPRYGMSAVYSSLTRRIYYFGGNDFAPSKVYTDTIYEIALEPNGHIGTVSLVSTAALPEENAGASAIEDPATGLIYLIGGEKSFGIDLFDAVTGELWRTPVQLPRLKYYASLIYDSGNRQALLIGGLTDTPSEEIESSIWRIPLGDGPAVALGRWDFPPLSTSPTNINEIDGDERAVLVGTTTGVTRFDASGTTTHYDQDELGLIDVDGIPDVAYVAEHDHVWVASGLDTGRVLLPNGAIRIYPMETASADIMDLRPGYSNPDDAPFFGTNEGLWWAPNLATVPAGWRRAFMDQTIRAMQHRAAGDLWLISANELQHYAYDANGGTPTSYGLPCNMVFGHDIAFSPNGDWWIAAGSPAQGQMMGICRIPGAPTPGGAGPGNILQPAIGIGANELDNDNDGRIWVTIGSQCLRHNESGGLVAYQAAGSPAVVRTTEWNWLNAPIASLLAKADDCGGPSFWVSGLGALSAVDERVWAGKFSRDLVTFAPRWQHLDESNNLDDKVIEGIWTVRGRAFMATATSLHVLAPDARTWDNIEGVHARVVIGDSRGSIWVGTDQGVRRYTPDGLQPLDADGEEPVDPVHALTEDRAGRVWIGHEVGLTLFDRGRFVVTLAGDTTGLPVDSVKALVADRQNRLWVGTSAGLARMDTEGWAHFGMKDGLPSNDIYDLAELGDGRIAVSTPAGLALFDGIGFAAESPPVPAANLPLSVDESGRLWAGSAVLTAQGWQGYYSTNSGLRSTTVSDNATDRADRVWFSHAPEPGVSVRGALLPPLADVVPIITGISPQQGRVGDHIIITGTGFGRNLADVEVTIGGARADVISVVSGGAGQPENLIARLTAENTSGDVSVSVGGRRTILPSGDTPTFCAIPAISSISPTGGNIGVRVELFGTNLDREATISLAGPLRRNETSKPTRLTALIQPGDGEGPVVVQNTCAGDAFKASSAETFRYIELSIVERRFNQGLAGADLVQGKPTLVQHYLSVAVAPRPTDRFEIDSIRLIYHNPGGGGDAYGSVPYRGQVAPTLGPPPPEFLKDISTSVNGSFSPSSVNFDGGDLAITSELSRNGQVAATTSSAVFFYPNDPLNVLLVPVMKEGYTAAELNAMKALINSGLEDARSRIMPMGWTNFFWSKTVVTRSDSVTIHSALDLIDVGHDLDEARDHYNEYHEDAVIAFGVVDPNLSTDGGGKALWADMTEFVNGILMPIDVACDILTLPGRLFGWDDCDLEAPLYIGWGSGGTSRDKVSQLFTHEFGHVLGLVGASASNGELGDNYSHSINDELDGGECGDAGTTFNWNKSLYAQEGVAEPVVNPISGQQFYPQNDGSPFTKRGKALMSYACADDNDNVFFEPVDVPTLLFEFGVSGHRGWVEDLIPGLVSAASPHSTGADAPPVLASQIPGGPRLSISGVVSNTGGEITRVKPLGERAPLSVGAASGYSLVQLDAAGHELDRLGVFAIGGAGDQPDSPRFFAATILHRPGLARLELRHDETLLDTFSPNSGMPQVTLTSPAGGAQGGATMQVAWTASDPDGDPLRITVEYSADAGASWEVLALVEESRTLDVPIGQLAGSNDARVRVTATDGFNSASAISPRIRVAAQAPIPYIAGPLASAAIMEGEVVTMLGAADDTGDGPLSGDALLWSSDRDGFLGAGARLARTLSAGTHLITLRAINSAGVEATTSVSVTVTADYDFDGIPDTEEVTDRLNPLDGRDAYADADGDNLPLIVERIRGLDPTNPDSDGDGRLDGDELAAGTDPGIADEPLPPDVLAVAPAAISFEADLALGTPLPMQSLVISSRLPVSWTLSADVPWLGASTRSGRTVDGVTIFLKAYTLEEGTHTGSLTFRSEALGQSVTVPVTATVSNRDAYFDMNDDGWVSVPDVQAVAGRIPSEVGEPDFDSRYDIDRDADIDAADIHLITPRWRVAPDIVPTGTAPLMRVAAPAAVETGESFTVEILAAGTQSMGGFEFQLAFDSQVLDVEGVELGGMLGQSGRATTALGPRVEATAGAIEFGAYSTGPGSAVNGDGILARITFRARESGNSSLNLQATLLVDPLGAGTVPVRQHGHVTVAGSPEGETHYLPLVLR